MRFYHVKQSTKLGFVLKELLDAKMALPKHLRVRENKAELAKLNRLEADLHGSTELLEIEAVADSFEKVTDREFN